MHLPASVEYTVTPVARGDVVLGPAVVRVDRSVASRLAADHRRRASRAVRVDPNLAAIDVYEALARRGQLAEIGLRTMRLRTEGSEFERVREAFPDDPLRSINWRATARTGRLMATELIPERAQPLVICLDHGRLMGIGAGELTKLDHAINAALLLVHVALRAGDRAGMLAFSDTVTDTLPPRAGTAQLRRFLDATRPSPQTTPHLGRYRPVSSCHPPWLMDRRIRPNRVPGVRPTIVRSRVLRDNALAGGPSTSCWHRVRRPRAPNRDRFGGKPHRVRTDQ